MSRSPFPAAVLACGCRLALADDPQTIPRVTVLSRAATCTIALHVAGAPLYDHRAAMRPSTRHHPPVQPDYEDG